MAANPIKPYLQLIRLPNVFTAGADSLAGWLFVGGTLAGSYRWVPLVLGSMTIYAGGIALNDVLDVEIDRAERPQRPIPSGRVPYGTALWLALFLLTSGWVSVSLAGERRSLAVAALLIAAVIAYDWGLRTTRLGPQVMGLCRGLNLLLGMTCGEVPLSSSGIVVYVVAYATFVTGVTWISRNEASGGGRLFPSVGTALQAFAFAGLAAVVVVFHLSPESLRVALFVLVGLAVLIFRADFRAIRAPGPKTIQPAVKTAILALVWLHVGVLLGVQGWLAALVVALFWVPAVTAGRWIYST